MNDDNRDDTTNRPVSLNNEATPDATVFVGAAPAPTSGAASGWDIYCDRKNMMRILKKRKISTERETRIFERGNGSWGLCPWPVRVRTILACPRQLSARESISTIGGSWTRTRSRRGCKSLAWTLPPFSRGDVRRGRPRWEGRGIGPGLMGGSMGVMGTLIWTLLPPSYWRMRGRCRRRLPSHPMQGGRILLGLSSSRHKSHPS